MTKRTPFCLLVVCLLVCPGLSQVPKPEQCLVSGIYSLIRLPEPQDAPSCWTDCSAEAECHVAVMVTPVSGSAQCLLVDCQKRGKHSFTRQPGDQITVYPKSTTDDVQRVRALYCETEIDLQPHQSHKIMMFSKYSGFPRFLYNSQSHRCEFFYSGCPSCRNNFETKEGCEALCSEKFRCHRPMQYGGCRAQMPKFFYNISSERCEGFTFSGCGSNGNIFPTVEECEDLCGDVKDTTVAVPTEMTGTTTSPPDEDTATTTSPPGEDRGTSPPVTSDTAGTTTSRPDEDTATTTSPPALDSVFLFVVLSVVSLAFLCIRWRRRFPLQ